MNKGAVLCVVSIDVYSLLLLLMVAFDLRRFVGVNNIFIRLLRWIVRAVLLAVLFDAIRAVADGFPGRLGEFLVYALNIFSDLLLLLLVCLFNRLTTAFENRRGTFGRLCGALCTAAFAAAVLLLAADSRTGLLFTVDSENHIHPQFGLAVFDSAILLLFLLLAFRFLISRAMKAYELPLLKLFWLPVVAGSMLQIYFYNTAADLTLAGISLSLFFVYIGLQSRNNRLDYLTGIYNRRYLDDFINDRVREGKFSAIILDIDHYKLINDNYGHQIGDEVLISVASILKVSVRRHDCVARYGGDEFVIVVHSGDESVLQTVIGRINYKLYQLNADTQYPFAVSLSMGYGSFGAGPYKTGREFIRHIDALMYREKKEKKGQKLTIKPVSPEKNALV